MQFHIIERNGSKRWAKVRGARTPQEAYDMAKGCGEIRAPFAECDFMFSSTPPKMKLTIEVLEEN